MIDMEKVIKALENCVNYSGDCINCVYIKHTACKTSLMIDALAALKEQEPVSPIKQYDGYPKNWASCWYVCGNCERPIDWCDKFCRSCGRAVKWE